MEIIKVDPSNLHVLSALGVLAFYESYSLYNSTDDMLKYTQKSFSHKQLEQELENGVSEYFIGFNNQIPATYIKINYKVCPIIHNKNIEPLELERIYVLQQYQRQSLGILWLDFIKNTYASKSERLLWLGVWEENKKAISFYNKNNFEKIGERKFQLGNRVCNDYILSKVI